MSYQHLAHLFTALREHLHQRHHADFDEAMRLLDELELEVGEAIGHDHGNCRPGCHHPHHRPAHIHVTTSQKGVPMGSYAINTDVDLTAVVKNDQGQNITDDVIWTATLGTVTAGANGSDADGGVTETAVLSGVTVPGDVAVTATTSNGLSFVDTITFTDPNAAVPASISVTDSAAAA